MNQKKVKRLAEELKLPIVGVRTRGNTDHRQDLLLKDGSILYLYKDGTIESCALKWTSKKLTCVRELIQC